MFVPDPAIYLGTVSLGGFAGMAAVHHTLTQVAKAFCFRIPPASTAHGHRAGDWPQDPIWTGRLKMVSKGDHCVLELEKSDGSGLWAQSIVRSTKEVQPVSDSSRYFVIRVDDGKGRHAYLGLGFNAREEAFEFKVALQDWENSKDSSSRARAEFDSIPTTDYSLPDGAKIQVSIKAKKSKKKPSSTEGKKASGGGLFALAPPPKASGKRRSKAKSKGSTNAAPAGAGAGASAADQDVLDLTAAFGGLGDNQSPSGESSQPQSQSQDDDPFAAMMNEASF